jgi:NADPH:quinone reductase-like Zn-dependent oxidoreductase
MRAAVLDHYGEGAPGVRDFPDPVPAPGEALVRLRAAALNRVDVYMRGGGQGITHTLPLVLGLDGAGEVVSAPPGSGLAAGDRVLLYPAAFCGRCPECQRGEQPFCERVRIAGEHRHGTFAELIAMPAACWLPIPAGLGFEEAAALPVAYLTAWRMLFGWGRPLGPGQTALVVGAGGGVASACVQLAHLAGARVLATSSTPEKLAHAAALGAAVTIDYRTENVPRRVLAETGGAGVDLVVDNVGAATWAQSLRSVRRGGRVVTCGATTGGDPPAELQRVFIRQIQIQGSTMGSLEEFRRLLAVVAAGRLRPAVERGFPLEEVSAALDHLAAGGQRGKLVLRIG